MRKKGCSVKLLRKGLFLPRRMMDAVAEVSPFKVNFTRGIPACTSNCWGSKTSSKTWYRGRRTLL